MGINLNSLKNKQDQIPEEFKNLAKILLKKDL